MLDKSLKYGTVCGIPGVRYEQGGKLFNMHGEEVDSEGKLVNPSLASAAVKPAVKPTVKSAGQVEESGVAIDPANGKPADDTDAQDAKPKKRRWS